MFEYSLIVWSWNALPIVFYVTIVNLCFQFKCCHANLFIILLHIFPAKSTTCLYIASYENIKKKNTVELHILGAPYRRAVRSYFVILAMVAIIAAIEDMLEPMLSISAGLVLREILLGTTISQPGSIFAPVDTFATIPFM